jgi:hypothetical protein
MNAEMPKAREAIQKAYQESIKADYADDGTGCPEMPHVACERLLAALADAGFVLLQVRR